MLVLMLEDHEHDRRHEVRDEVLAHDEGKPRAHAARGEDVLAVADLPNFAPDNAGQGEPAGDADDESDGELVRFAHEGKDQQQGQKDRDTLQEFHRPHHGAVHHAGGDPGQAAVRNPIRVMTAALISPMKMEALPPYQMIE